MTEKDRMLLEFGRWCLDAHRSALHEGGSGPDEFEIQDKAIELGLLVYVDVTEPCCEDCWCAEYNGEFPCKCLREVEP